VSFASRARRHDEAEQRERSIGGAEEEPLADATADDLAHERGIEEYSSSSSGGSAC
jgi:hypothetical protein